MLLPQPGAVYVLVPFEGGVPSWPCCLHCLHCLASFAPIRRRSQGRAPSGAGLWRVSVEGSLGVELVLGRNFHLGREVEPARSRHLSRRLQSPPAVKLSPLRISISDGSLGGRGPRVPARALRHREKPRQQVQSPIFALGLLWLGPKGWPGGRSPRVGRRRVPRCRWARICG